jgi:hypothetical protein
VIALAAALATTLTGTGWALAEFGKSVTLSHKGEDASAQQIAVGPGGDAVIVWQRFDGTNIRIQARVRSATGVYGPVENVSPAGESAVQPRVAVDNSGNALIVWNGDGIKARIRPT